MRRQRLANLVLAVGEAGTSSWYLNKKAIFQGEPDDGLPSGFPRGPKQAKFYERKPCTIIQIIDDEDPDYETVLVRFEDGLEAVVLTDHLVLQKSNKPKL